MLVDFYQWPIQAAIPSECSIGAGGSKLLPEALLRKLAYMVIDRGMLVFVTLLNAGFDCLVGRFFLGP